MQASVPKDDSKFALVALKNAYVELPSSPSFKQRLSNGTVVMTRMPVEIDTGWRELIGSLRHDSLTKANFVLMYSEESDNPEILDRQHLEVEKKVEYLFHLLQLSGRCEYQKANLVVGSLSNGKSDVRRMSEISQFYKTRGDKPLPISIDRLESAVKSYDGLKLVEADAKTFKRLKRGLKALMEGLQKYNGEDRIHEFVRSLEALILPDIGKTKKQFVYRCQTFAKRTKKLPLILEEAFEMRSMATHLNDWEKALHPYSPSSRENTALLRTLQMERLACFCYSRLLDDQELRSHFINENELEKFWKLQDHQRSKIWGNQLGL